MKGFCVLILVAEPLLAIIILGREEDLFLYNFCLLDASSSGRALGTENSCLKLLILQKCNNSLEIHGFFHKWLKLLWGYKFQPCVLGYNHTVSFRAVEHIAGLFLIKQNLFLVSFFIENMLIFKFRDLFL